MLYIRIDFIATAITRFLSQTSYWLKFDLNIIHALFLKTLHNLKTIHQIQQGNQCDQSLLFSIRKHLLNNYITLN